MSRPSVVFLAAIEANAVLDRLDDKLRNCRRPLSKSERYAVSLLLDKFDNAPGLGTRIDRALARLQS